MQTEELSVGELISEIERQTDFLVLYRNREVDTDRIIRVSSKSGKLTAYLGMAFADTDVTYEIDNKYILLSKRLVLNNSKPANVKASQQTGRTINGTVKDSNGELIIGASIIVRGTTIGTVTDVDGRFSLSVPQNATLQVSFIGYQTKEVATGNQSTVDVILIEDTKLLDEVVVIGYGTQKKVNLTGAITSVKAETLDNMPVANLSNALAGRAPGVTVTGTSGFAGASSSIRMRGSFSEPLYVINDVIKSKQYFDALDPNEVESISFLKDAASAAVYGSKAGNGVVLVKTKSGRQQKPAFQYKGSYSASSPTQPLQSFTATDQLTYENRVAQSLGRDPVYGQEHFDYFADKNYDVNDYVWQNPSVQQHNLSVDGGNDRITYFMLLGYHDENGSYKTVNYKRYNFRSDITAKITERFKVNFNLSGYQQDFHRFYWPYDDIENFNVPDFYRTTFNWTRYYPFYLDENNQPTTDTSKNPITSGSWNPVEMVLGNRYQDVVRRHLDGQIRLDLDLGQYVDGLRTSVLGQYYGYDRNHKAFITHNKGYRFKIGSPTNIFVPGPIDPNDMVTHNLSASYEGIRENVTLEQSYQLNWFLNYDKIFGKHAVSVMAVYEQSAASGKSLSGQADELMTTTIDQIFNTSSDTQRRFFSGSESESARQSWVGRANYTYADKYIAEFSFRYDGNYKFAPAERWGFFPSASVAWRLSEESFLHDVSWLSNLKLRANYGSTGDDNNWNGDGISAFQWREYYRNGSGYIFGDNLNTGLAIGNTPNPFISWAKVEVYDIGLEYGFLDNRLSGELDYFYRNKNHILRARNRVIPGTYGASLSNENYAEQDWNGVDWSLKWSDTYRDLRYTVYANMGYAIDKWMILDEPEGLEAWRSQIGKPNNRLSGYISEGMIRTQEQLDALPEGFTIDGRKPILGTLLFRDIRGANYSEGPDGKIDGNDATYLSDNATPRINYGFGFNLEWKGFALDAHFQGVGAYDRMVSTMNGGGVFQMGDRPYFALWKDDVWTPENPNAKYPRVSGAWMQQEYGGGSSTFWLRNGAFCRLKNLNIAYTLPKNWLAGIGVNQLQLFVNATNLFCISAMEEYDPEQNTLDSYPLMRTFTGGLSINF
ncbi:MAG: TonB-dependent receptor [Tannerella sp.]|nr:TonB-dependent receptor [Tannerella sp.]